VEQPEAPWLFGSEEQPGAPGLPQESGDMSCQDFSQSYGEVEDDDDWSRARFTVGSPNYDEVSSPHDQP